MSGTNRVGMKRQQSRVKVTRSSEERVLFKLSVISGETITVTTYVSGGKVPYRYGIGFDKGAIKVLKVAPCNPLTFPSFIFPIEEQNRSAERFVKATPAHVPGGVKRRALTK